MTREEIIESLDDIVPKNPRNDWSKYQRQIVNSAIDYLKQELNTDKYEYHTDHTDCIWYGSDSGCPVTCSQYRDGWNDAMEYVYKNGKGYQPYRRE